MCTSRLFSEDRIEADKTRKCDAVDVSVLVAVYNHEAYIRQALSSVLMQKVNFRFEVLIGEDCSTDQSREVIDGMALPENFIRIYNERNLGIRENYRKLYGRMRGRYFIVLEGDDYWTDERKFQIQYDFLESHPEYIAAAHRTRVVNRAGTPIAVRYPECRHAEYTLRDYEKGLLPGQTATVMRRNYWAGQGYCPFPDCGTYPAGDRVNAFYYLTNGKVYCMPQVMSAYRFVVNGGSSFSATYRYDVQKEWAFYSGLYCYVQENPVQAEARLCIEKMYAFFLLKCAVRGQALGSGEEGLETEEIRKDKENLESPVRKDHSADCREVGWRRILSEQGRLFSDPQILLYLLGKIVSWPVRRVVFTIRDRHDRREAER